MGVVAEKLSRLKKGYKKGGFEYLLYSITSRFPEWLFRYYHTFLFAGENPKIITRKNPGYTIRFANVQDAGRFADVESDREKALERLERGDSCVIAVRERDAKVVTISWAATGKLYNRFAGTILDTGKDGYYTYGIYSIPEERLKGLHSNCYKMQVEHYEKMGRVKKYGTIDCLNTNSIKIHQRMGDKKVGETYYLALLGISLCYYKKWPFSGPKVDVFFRRPPRKLKWV